MAVSPTKVLYRPAANTGNDLTGAVMRDLGEQSVAPAGDYVPWAMAADPNGAITITAAATAPAQMAAPAVTSAGQTSISVDLAAAPADGGSAITSYDLRWQEDAGSWTTVTGVSDPATVGSLTADTLYNVQTRAVNAVGDGPWSPSGSATTDAAVSGFTDNFNQANGTDLITLPEYSEIVVWGGTIEAQSGHAEVVSASGRQWLSYVGATLGESQYAEGVTEVPSGADVSFRLYLRATANNMFYMLDVVNTSMKLYYANAGSSVKVGSTVYESYSASDIFRLEFDNATNTLTSKRNGSTLHSEVVPAIASGGDAGFELNKDAQFSSFSCGDL